jgi:glycosyltransferase involved in cell wall biosynthesis
MKTITVIVPTYNRLPLLKNLLAGLDNQRLSRDHFDLIVVDDGSTDGTVETLRASGISFITQTHQGPAAARNAGAAKAVTPFLLFIDDDAIPRENWLKAAHEAVTGNKELFAAEGDVVLTGEKVPLSHSVHHQGPGGMLSCNLLVSRDLFSRMGGFNEKFYFPMNEDFDFFLRLKAFAPVRYLPEMTVEHPVYPLSFFKTLFDSMAYARRRIYSEHLLYRLHLGIP